MRYTLAVILLALTCSCVRDIPATQKAPPVVVQVRDTCNSASQHSYGSKRKTRTPSIVASAKTPPVRSDSAGQHSSHSSASPAQRPDSALSKRSKTSCRVLGVPCAPVIGAAVVGGFILGSVLAPDDHDSPASHSRQRDDDDHHKRMRHHK